MEKDNYVQGFKLIAAYQLIGGALGAFRLASFVFQLQVFSLLLIFLVIAGFSLFLFSMYAGILLFKRDSNALQLSLVNHYLQLFSVAGPAFLCNYVAGISVLLGLDLTNGFHVELNASLSDYTISVESGMTKRFLGFNLVAFGFIFYLHHAIKDISRERIRDQIDSIGS